MRFTVAFNAALSLGLMGGGRICQGFVAPTPFRSLQANLHLGAERWINRDDALDAVAKDDNGEGINSSQGDDDESTVDESQGGSRFKEMMKAAKSSGKQTLLGAPPVNPYANAVPAVPPPPPPAANLEGMSTEEQAAMFRQMMQQQQQQQRGYLVPQPQAPQQRGGVDAKGRKIGRNRDTDTISNTSDLYFAQLKRDSTVRTMARYDGNENVANDVMGDDGVTALNDQLQTNPYLQRENRHDSELIEVSLQDIVPQNVGQQQQSSSGVSFKEKLKAFKQKAGVAGKQDSTTTSAPATPPPPKVEPVTTTPPAPEPTMVEPAPVVNPVAAAPLPAPLPEPVPVPAQQTLEGDEDPEMRTKIRKLMGMFLKHRGGPGFGSGMLRGKEAEDFENLLIQVGSTLRQEVGGATPTDTPTKAAVEIPSPPPPMADPQPQVVSPPATTTTTTTTSDVSSAIACVEGAVQMYKNCPPEMKESMLVALRGALLSAANACSSGEQPVEKQGEVISTRSNIEPMEAAAPVAVREPPKETITTPAATLSPVTSTAALGNNDIDDDSNSRFLNKVYDSLSAVSGDGKFGLGGKLDANQASALADDLYKMRDVLMEELESGIPIPEKAPLVTQEGPSKNNNSGSSTKTKYQEMLERARAAKSM